MASAEVHKTTQSMFEMQKLLKAKAQAAAVTQGHKAALAAVSDPASLIYTDPHSYAYWIERQNLSLFSLVSLPSDIWAQLKNTPFLRYAYHGVFAIDVGRLDTECQWHARVEISRETRSGGTTAPSQQSHSCFVSRLLLRSLSQGLASRCSSWSASATCTRCCCTTDGTLCPSDHRQALWLKRPNRAVTPCARNIHCSEAALQAQQRLQQAQEQE